MQESRSEEGPDHLDRDGIPCELAELLIVETSSLNMSRKPMDEEFLLAEDRSVLLGVHNNVVTEEARRRAAPLWVLVGRVHVAN